jgi:TctA family transporter
VTSDRTISILAVFAVITVWQIGTVIGSPYPGMKAVEALGLLFPFYLLLFASTYFVMERAPACGSCSGPYAGARNGDPIRATISARPPAR